MTLIWRHCNNLLLPCSPRRSMYPSYLHLAALVAVVIVVLQPSAAMCPSPSPCSCTLQFPSCSRTLLHLNCTSRGLRDVADMTSLLTDPLYIVDLSYNRLRHLRSYGFFDLHFHSFESEYHPKIVLSHNPLQRFERGALEGIHAEHIELYLVNVSLRTFPTAELSHLTNLTKLDLTASGLRSLPAGAFKSFTKLRTLGLNDNHLVALESTTFLGLELSLEYLYLVHTSLHTFPTKALHRLEHLTHLELSRNTFSNLSEPIFQGFQTRLLPLDLYMRSCKITDISPEVFTWQGVLLSTLDLNHNRLKSLDFLQDPCSLALMPGATLALTSNPLDCSCADRQLWARLPYPMRAAQCHYGGYLETDVDNLIGCPGAGSPITCNGYANSILPSGAILLLELLLLWTIVPH